MSVLSQTKVVSGSSLITVASGFAFLRSVIPFQLSGSSVSYSGQVLRVIDATSGMSSLTSGGTPLYQFDFGAESGLGASMGGAGAGQSAPMLTGIDATCLSGIVVQGATGYGVTIVYSK